MNWSRGVDNVLAVGTMLT